MQKKISLNIQNPPPFWLLVILATLFLFLWPLFILKLNIFSSCIVLQKKNISFDNWKSVALTYDSTFTYYYYYYYKNEKFPFLLHVICNTLYVKHFQIFIFIKIHLSVICNTAQHSLFYLTFCFILFCFFFIYVCNHDFLMPYRVAGTLVSVIACE